MWWLFRGKGKPCFTCGTPVPKPKPEIDLEAMAKTCEQFRSAFLDTFATIPTRVDPTLTGKKYYLAVSPELLKELNGYAQKGNGL